MKTFELNGKLKHLKDYEIFKGTVNIIWNIFVDTFGTDVMKKYDLFLDNALEMTGHTPTIIPVLQKYLIIKLHIKNFSDEEKIAYQFSHELCHYVFYSLEGINDRPSDSVEENICEAMSLVIISRLFPHSLEGWSKYVSEIEDPMYNKGAIIAKKINYDIEKIKILIYKKCGKKLPESID